MLINPIVTELCLLKHIEIYCLSIKYEFVERNITRSYAVEMKLYMCNIYEV